MLGLFFVFSAILAVMTVFSTLSWAWLFSSNGLVFLISLLDLMLLPKREDLSFNRKIPEELERGIAYSVQIEIANASTKSCEIRLIDGLPQSFRAPFPLEESVEAQQTSVLSYQVTAPVRGKYDISKLFIRYRSIFGLWEKQMATVIKQNVKVIPDLTETKRYLESPQRFLLHEGTEIKKQHAVTGEFAQIRNYVIGDDPRKINWRQTAKLQQIMTNEYQPEHGKYVTILIDCGRMMGAELKTGNRLEKSLEAAVTTAAAALDNGDYVAVLAFSSGIQQFIPPDKGMKHLQKILQTIYNLNVEASEANYSAAFNYLSASLKKRSLILLFSDIQTFLYEDTVLHHLKRLRQRHLFLMIGIEDEIILKATQRVPDSTKTAMVKSIAQQQIQFKKRKKTNWEKQGLSMVEAKEEHLTSTAVSRYIRTMNEELL
ncbi:membrane protein [Lentibacillus kapialis]|uniref:Membrane protein n=2 Tax=Lentibacillus kapialis TaxID=340214 RepID=A0A917PVZ4_9BACI|nr:membrane protein [Lentibacillus kapialis]